MALNYTERRRIALAATLTVLALPALWWANQSEGASAPNVATVGVEVGIEDGTESTTAGVSKSVLADTIGESEPVFLDGPAGETGFGAAEVAVPATPTGTQITTSASYSSSISNSTLCIAPGIAHGTEITVVNLDNNRSTSCVTVRAPSDSDIGVILQTQAFSHLADLTDAPIPVEIRQ